MKDITSYNDNGELDGYWEMYDFVIWDLFSRFTLSNNIII